MTPRILLNTHKHAAYKWRATVGKHNGYGNTPEEAYWKLANNVTKCAHNAQRRQTKALPARLRTLAMFATKESA